MPEQRLARTRAAYSPDVQVERDERAAIMEYDGGLTREEAERRADDLMELVCSAPDLSAD